MRGWRSIGWVMLLSACAASRQAARSAPDAGTDAGNVVEAEPVAEGGHACLEEVEKLDGVAARTGCEFGAEPTPLAIASVYDKPAEQIIVRGAEFFLRHGSGPKITAGSTCGGSLRLVSCALAGGDIAVDERHVYWRKPLLYPLSSGELWRVDRADGAAELLAAGEGDGYSAEVEVDATNVYFSVCCDRQTEMDSGIYAWPKLGGERSAVLTGWWKHQIALEQDHLYFIGAPDAGSMRGGLVRVAVTGAEPEQLLPSDPSIEIGGFAVHGRHVYYRYYFVRENRYELRRMQLDSREVETLIADTQQVPQSFVVDADGLFGWLERTDGVALVRVALSGGEPVEIVRIDADENRKVGALALDGQAIYWTDSIEECAYIRQLGVDLAPMCRFLYQLRVMRVSKAFAR